MSPNAYAIPRIVCFAVCLESALGTRPMMLTQQHFQSTFAILGHRRPKRRRSVPPHETFQRRRPERLRISVAEMTKYPARILGASPANARGHPRAGDKTLRHRRQVSQCEWTKPRHLKRRATHAHPKVPRERGPLCPQRRRGGCSVPC